MTYPVRSRALLRWLALLAGLFAFSALTPTARAEVRGAVLADPQDQPASIDGVPHGADVESMRVQYDPSGTVTAVARFFGPTAGDYRFLFTLTTGNAQNPCAGTTGPPGTTAYGGTYTRSSSSDTPMGYLGLSDLTGDIPATVTISADKREVMVEATHPALANRDYTCANGETISDTSAYYSRACNCIRRAVDYDDVPFFALVGGQAISKVVAPPPPAPPAKTQCADGLDNDSDGQIDAADDWGCVNQADNDERLTTTPLLPAADAKAAARAALRGRYKTVYTSGRSKRTACRRRSAQVFRCEVSWVRNGRRYAGTATITRARRGEDVVDRHRIAVRSSKVVRRQRP